MPLEGSAVQQGQKPGGGPHRHPATLSRLSLLPAAIGYSAETLNHPHLLSSLVLNIRPGSAGQCH